jgi:hypothetical protein
VVICCVSRSAVVRTGRGVVAGVFGVHLYWSPWSGCVWECGLIGGGGARGGFGYVGSQRWFGERRSVGLVVCARFGQVGGGVVALG